MNESLLVEMPGYIPMIHHGSNVSFKQDSKGGPWVAIPLSKFFRYSRKHNALRPVFASEEQLRERFSLTVNAKIIAVGVGFDQFIEDYWQDNRVERLPAVLRQLGVRCFIPPNFSMFRDAPRTQHLHNRRRSLLCAMRAAEAGLGVIPYLSALTDYDWGMMESFLREHPEITYVAEEFQTGTASRDFAVAVIDRIAVLESRLGRPLHPVLIGARRFLPSVKRAFKDFTLIDSNAFFDAQCRRKPVFVGDRLVRKKAVGKTGRNFARSVRLYSRKVRAAAEEQPKSSTPTAARERPTVCGQLSLTF